MPRRLLFYGLALAAVVVGVPAGARLWIYYQTHETTDDAYVTADIVPVSFRVAGTVISVNVGDHQTVAADQLLARLDPREFEARVRQARASVNVAAARLRSAEREVSLAQDSTTSDTDRTSAGLRGARSAHLEALHAAEEAEALKRTREAAVAACQADVDVQVARLDLARSAHERTRMLLARGVASRHQFDEADTALRRAEAEWQASKERLAQARSECDRVEADLQTRRQAVERARARVAEAQAQLAGSRANRQSVDIKQAQVQVAQALLEQAEADLAYAELQLAYTTIRSPAAGVIAKKSLDVGQVVQPGRPVLAVVSLDSVSVEANFKETQLRNMAPGQKATLEVDAYPGVEIAGTVKSISPGTGAVFSLLPPENATGNFVKVVQRVPVKILLDESRERPPLRPGMSVVATVTTR